MAWAGVRLEADVTDICWGYGGKKRKRERGWKRKKNRRSYCTHYPRAATAAFDVHARPEQHNKIHQSTGGAAFKTHSARRQSSKKETMKPIQYIRDEKKRQEDVHLLESIYRKRGCMFYRVYLADLRSLSLCEVRGRSYLCKEQIKITLRRQWVRV